MIENWTMEEMEEVFWLNQGYVKQGNVVDSHTERMIGTAYWVVFGGKLLVSFIRWDPETGELIREAREATEREVRMFVDMVAYGLKLPEGLELEEKPIDPTRKEFIKLQVLADVAKERRWSNQGRAAFKEEMRRRPLEPEPAEIIMFRSKKE